MRVFVLLVFISTVINLVTSIAVGDEVRFPVKVLEPDVSAIEKYHKKIDTQIPAFIQWPDDIVFHVESEEINENKYVKVNGKFLITYKLSVSSYSCVYYRDSTFYVMSNSKQELKTIEPTVEVVYKQTMDQVYPEKGGSFLMIYYEKLENVVNTMKSLNPNDIQLSKGYRANSPSTYLALWTSPVDHILEYTLSGGNAPKGLEIFTLTVKDKGRELKVYSNEKYSGIVLDQTSESVFFLDDSKILTSPPKTVFGVRMASVGYLTEARVRDIKMLGDEDIQYGASADNLMEHGVFLDDLLEKVKKVEPRPCPNDDPNCLLLLPASNKFQVHGHILIKKINYSNLLTFKIDEECPFLIEHVRPFVRFMYGGQEVNDLCTNEEKIWAGYDKNAQRTNGFVKLLYEDEIYL